MSTAQEPSTFKPISLEDWDCFGEGATASSYNNKKDDGVMLKLFSSGIPAAEAQKEKAISDILIQRNISIPAAYEMVECQGRYGVVYQRIKDKVSISRALANNPEDLSQLAQLFAQECKKLHATPCDMDYFPSKVEESIAIVNRSSFIDEHQRVLITDFLKGAEVENSCLHGDMHIGNLILAGEQQTPYWIDLAGFGYGNHYFDLGLLYYVLNVGDGEEGCMRLYHNKPQTLKEFWKCFAPAYLGTDDEAVAAEFMQNCCKFAVPALLTIMEAASPTPTFKLYRENMMRQLAELMEKF